MAEPLGEAAVLVLLAAVMPADGLQWLNRWVRLPWAMNPISASHRASVAWRPSSSARAGYDPIGLSVDLAATRARVLIRIRSDRVVVPDPEARPAGIPGAPRRPSAGLRPRRGGELAGSRRGPQHHGSPLRPGRGADLEWAPPRLARRGRWVGEDGPLIVAGSVIRVALEHLPGPPAAP